MTGGQNKPVMASLQVTDQRLPADGVNHHS